LQSAANFGDEIGRQRDNCLITRSEKRRLQVLYVNTRQNWFYEGPEGDDKVFYIAVCPRTDHPMVRSDVTPDGYWTGAAVNDFAAALKDAQLHGHSETLITRCSLTDNTCGPVWITK